MSTIAGSTKIQAHAFEYVSDPSQMKSLNVDAMWNFIKVSKCLEEV